MLSLKFPLFIFIILFPILSLIGCASMHPERSPGQQLDDAIIENNLQTSYLNCHDIPANEIKISVYKGEVQLSGFVENKEQKQRAEMIAEATPGVQDVENDINLKN